MKEKTTENAAIPNYEYIELAINAKSISTLAKLERARDVSEGMVKTIFDTLNSGGSIDDPIAVNKVPSPNGTVYRLIDGGHRLEAIRRMIAQNRSYSIVVGAKVFSGLTPEQEFDVFDRNIQRRQTVGQRIELHGYPLWKLMAEDFPGPVYWQGKKPSGGYFDGVQLLRAYMSVGLQNGMAGGGTFDAFRPDLTTNATATHRALKEFASALVEAFGAPRSYGTPWFRPLILTALARIYFGNIERGSKPATIVDAWKKHLASNVSVTRELNAYLLGGLGAARVLHVEQLVVDAMCHSGFAFTYPTAVWSPKRSGRVNRR